MQLDDRLRHLGFPEVEVDDDAALATTRRRVGVRRPRRMVGSFGAVMLLVGMAAGAVVLISGDRQSQVATVGPPRRYLPAEVPDDLELTTVDAPPKDVAPGTRVEDGPGTLRVGYQTDPPQPRWLDLEAFPNQVLDIDKSMTSWRDARRVELGDGRPAVLRGDVSLAWNLEGSVLRLDAHGMSAEELIAVATSVFVVDDRTWAEATAGADVGPPYGFLEDPQLVAEGPGWQAQVGMHRPWLQRRAERLVLEAATGSGLILDTQYDSADQLHVGHARSGKTVIALGVGPKGATSFRLTYGDVVVEADAVVAGSGNPVFAADVGPVESEPTEIAAFDGDGRRITGVVQPPTPLDLGP